MGYYDNHPLSDQVRDYIEHNPESHISSISTQLDIPESKVRKILTALEDTNKIIRATLYGQKGAPRIVWSKSPPVEKSKMHSHAPRISTDDVLDFINKMSGVTVSIIAHYFGADKEAIRNHVDILRHAHEISYKQDMSTLRGNFHSTYVWFSKDEPGAYFSIHYKARKQ